MQSTGPDNAGLTAQVHATEDGTWRPLTQGPSPVSRPSTDRNAEDQCIPDAGRPNSQWRPTSSSMGQHAAQRQQHLSSEAGQDARQSVNLQSDVLRTFVTSSSDAVGLLFKAAEQNNSDSSDEHAESDDIRQNDMPGSVYSMPSPALASNETLSLWEQHRFVRQGWFTSREAVSYIEL